MDFTKYAHSFQVFPRLGLERIFALTEALGHPERQCRCIHIAGTNGKGSVSFALASILKQSGACVGLYTSPNLVTVNERIRINGEPISNGDLASVIARVETASQQVQTQTGELPTPFEIWTASAFLWFAECGCDYVVLETGMGGRFDATNIIPKNELSILTRIDYDHTAHLGNTLTEITGNKCGIFKNHQTYPVVLSAPQQEEAKAEIKREAEIMGLCPRFVEPPAPADYTDLYEVVDFPSVGKLQLPFAGVHQIENIALAVEAAKILGIAPETIRQGLAQACHPARMEVLRKSPLLLYDGGHNPNGITALVTSLKRYKKDTKWTVIFAAMRDKDITPSLKLLSPLCERMFCTTVQNNPRALSSNDLCEKAKEQIGRAHV